VTGPTSRLLDEGTDSVDPLSFDLPAWGHMGSAGHLGLSDALFLAMFAGWTWHYGLRRAATVAGMTLGLLASLALSVELDRAIPALPLIAAGYLLPNLDRFPAMLARAGTGG
jgi:Na+/proline symporter